MKERDFNDKGPGKGINLIHWNNSIPTFTIQQNTNILL